MKMKNTLLLCLTLSFSFMCNARDPLVAGEESIQPVTDETVFLESFLEESATPLDSSIRNFRDFFASHDVASLHLKSRHVEPTNRTSRFNESFLRYIKEVYNQRDYANILSLRAKDLVQFFEIGEELNLTAAHMYVGTRLFYNKLKEAEIINDTVILEVMPAITGHLAHFFDTSEKEENPLENLDFIKKHTEDVILYKFTEHFTRFQSHPDSFIEELATDLARFYRQQEEVKQHALSKQATEQETLIRLRQMLVRFFELSISKTMWNITEPETIWPSVLGIANNLRGLAEHKILDHMDDLDDLLWTLTHRFAYFIELAGADLPLRFYEKVEDSLINRSVYFLEVQEQDDGITPKKQILIEALVKGKTRSIAAEKGIIAKQF